MKYLFTLLFLLSPFSFAEDEISLLHLKPPNKTEDPNTLWVWTSAESDCEITKKQLQKIVEGSLIRSRIKPADEYTDPSLSVQLKCMNVSTFNPIFDLTTRFGYFDFARDSSVFFGRQYNKLGMGQKKMDIETVIKDSVDEAMEDYIRANFLVD